MTPRTKYETALALWRSKLYAAQLDALSGVLQEARASLDHLSTTSPRSEADLLALTQIAHEIARELRETEQKVERLLTP